MSIVRTFCSHTVDGMSKLRLGEGPGAARESGQFHGLMEGAAGAARIVV